MAPLVNSNKHLKEELTANLKLFQESRREVIPHNAFCKVTTACMLLSCVQLLATLWTTARQAPVYGIFQARILEWVAISTIRESS